MNYKSTLLALIIILLISAGIQAQTKTVGLITYDSALSYKGYTLFSPIASQNTYLIDNRGYLIHSWSSHYRPAQSVMLLPDGSILRPGFVESGNSFNAGGAGGVIEKYDWDGNLTWSFSYMSDQYCTHHDVEYLPNGNVLIIAWEKISHDSAVAAGRNPAPLDSVLWADKIVEVKPTGPTTGDIVWEWHSWDHLIQDFDSTKENYGNVAAHPELIDVNFGINGIDWLHVNSVRYNAQRDEILISAHNFNEIWVIDHSTTTAQAAGHTGGKRGKGGDLIYRWGNPQAYRAGTAADQKLFLQHDVRWIDPGLPGQGDILIFNNGQKRPGGNYSSVDEITPPIDSNGNYYAEASGKFGPDFLSWIYKAQPPSSFYARNISGADRLPNGNTLICDGTAGRFFEVNNSFNIVWEYVNPVSRDGILTQGSQPQFNLVFKIYRYSSQYPGLAGKDLSEKGLIEKYPSGVEEENSKPEKFMLGQNYPNPFNPSTTIEYSLPQLDQGSLNKTFVHLAIYDVLGREIAVLENRLKSPGTYEVHFNSQDFHLTSGIYIYGLTAGTHSAFRKMILLK